MISKEEMLRYLESHLHSDETPEMRTAEDVIHGMTYDGFRFSIEPKWDRDVQERYYVVLFTTDSHVSHTTASAWDKLEDAIIRAAYNIMWAMYENSK